MRIKLVCPILYERLDPLYFCSLQCKMPPVSPGVPEFLKRYKLKNKNKKIELFFVFFKFCICLWEEFGIVTIFIGFFFIINVKLVHD